MTTQTAKKEVRAQDPFTEPSIIEKKRDKSINKDTRDVSPKPIDIFSIKDENNDYKDIASAHEQIMHTSLPTFT